MYLSGTIRTPIVGMDNLDEKVTLDSAPIGSRWTRTRPMALRTLESDGESGQGSSLATTSDLWNSEDSNGDGPSDCHCRCPLFFEGCGEENADEGYVEADGPASCGGMSEVEEDDSAPSEGEDMLDGRRYRSRLSFTRRSRRVFGPVRDSRAILQAYIGCECGAPGRDCCESSQIPVYITDTDSAAETPDVSFGLTLRNCTYRDVLRHFAVIDTEHESLAASFEIQTGDELLAVDGQPVVNVAPEVTAGYFRALLVGEEISFIFRRLLDSVDENGDREFQFIKSSGRVVGETWDGDSVDSSDSEGEPLTCLYRAHLELTYSATCSRGQGVFMLDNAGKTAALVSGADRTLVFQDAGFGMKAGDPTPEEASINVLCYINRSQLVRGCPDPEVRYQISHALRGSSGSGQCAFMMASPPDVTCRNCAVDAEGCPEASQVVDGMWFSRRYRSTGVKRYVFSMTSRPDYYLTIAGPTLTVTRLPGDQSENDNIRFEIQWKW